MADIIPSVITSTLRADHRLGCTRGLPTATATEQAYERQCGIYHYHTGSMVDLLRVNGVDPTKHANGVFSLRRYVKLTMSFREPNPGAQPVLFGRIMNLAKLAAPIATLGINRDLATLWVEKLLGGTADRAWFEPIDQPDTDVSDKLHLRLFCDPTWHPIDPPVNYADELKRRRWKIWPEVVDGWQREEFTP